MAVVLWTASPDAATDLLSEHLTFQAVPWRVVHSDHAPVCDKNEDVLLGMGTKVWTKFQAAGLAPKNRALSSQRSKRFCTPAGIPALMTFDPGLVMREADKRSEIQWDTNLAIRLMQTGTLRPKVGSYKWGRLHEVVANVNRLTHDFAGGWREPAYVNCPNPKRTVLTLDLETHGLYPWYDDRDIVTSQWTWANGQSLVVDHRPFKGPQGYAEGIVPPVGFEDWEDYEQFMFLTGCQWISLWGANLKYDSVWIAEKWKREIKNFTFDTTLGGSLVDENRSNSLNNHTKIYVPSLGGYDDAFNQKADKSNMPGELEKDPNEFLLYSGGDSDATRQVGYAIAHELKKDHRLARFYQTILHPAARAFERIERRGVVVDPDRYEELNVEVQADIDRLTHDAMMAIPLPVRAKHAEKLKLSRPTLLRDAFFSEDGYGLKPKKENLTPKTKAPQTSMDHFKKFSDTEAKPLIDALEALGSAKKTMSTYIVGFLKHIRPDNRFHPTYALHHGGLFDGGGADSGTVSGRLAAKEPAIQTLPKHTSYAKMLRSAYPAPEGYEFWQLDFSQGELRCTAEIADEANMIKVYQGDGDLHSLTAAELNGYQYEDFKALKSTDLSLWKKLRQGGKAGNFGLIYGMGAKGFMIYAYSQYGVVMTLAEATAFRNKFLNVLYPRLPYWHEDQVEEAAQWKYVRSPLGRIRHLPLIDSPLSEISSKAERQSINAPVQSLLNDMCLLLISMIEDAYGDCEHDFSINGSTHDAVYGYVKKGMTPHWFPKVMELHEEMHEKFRTVFEWDPQVDFPIDWERGPNWAKLEECHANGELKLAA